MTETNNFVMPKSFSRNEKNSPSADITPPQAMIITRESGSSKSCLPCHLKLSASIHEQKIFKQLILDKDLQGQQSINMGVEPKIWENPQIIHF